MAAKEEAEELVDKMYNTEHCGIKHFPTKRYCECSEMNWFQAKQCAIVAVDNELKSIMILFHYCGSNNYMKQELSNKIDELKEVKEEINKL